MRPAHSIHVILAHADDGLDGDWQERRLVEEVETDGSYGEEEDEVDGGQS